MFELLYGTKRYAADSDLSATPRNNFLGGSADMTRHAPQWMRCT
ncbi:MAG: hypothetical protein AAF601_09970 [Pseudomonadota bacterium]